MRWPPLLALAALVLAVPPGARAERPACNPCAGVVVAEPGALAAALEAAPLPDEATLFVAWAHRLGEPAAAGAAAALAEAGAVPWAVTRIETPAPLLERVADLETELAALAELAGALGPGAHVQLGWAERPEPRELAFLIKRAAVAVTGAAPDAQLVIGPLPVDEAFLRALYAEELAAYVDGVVVPAADAGELARAAALMTELDPGVLVALEAAPLPDPPLAALAGAAAAATAGAPLAFFALPDVAPESLAPFRLLAVEFHGDLAPDPGSTPLGAGEAWSFVRGEDLGLRVVVVPEPGASWLTLEFPDPALRGPALFDPASGEAIPLYGIRTGGGFEVSIEEPAPVLLLALERMSTAELADTLGVEEELTVADARQVPVEEILRRLQAFEDAQRRRLGHYRAVNTTHLRFQAGTGAQSVETTFSGPFFFRQGEGFDWAWNEFFFNGVRWRSKKIPQIPLIQPEKATALPVEITFTREYRYRLRGTAEVDGRDCWVIDFEPAVAVEPGKSLYQGTVWVDRQIYARVRTRAVQLGLAGDVLSNDETVIYSPLDELGEPAPWSPQSYFLPLRLVGQQLFSLLSTATVVEREILLTEVRINDPEFEAARRAALDSEATMVRDTERGLRYLVFDEDSGERVVQEKLDPKRRFLIGGVFWDESQDFPVPLAGINWLWFDWRGTGTQANVFFAGALFNVAITDPDFRGSKFDVGFDVFGLAFAPTDTRFRGGREVPGENVDVFSPSIDFKVGRPIGPRFKLQLEYELEYKKFTRADDTAAEFVLPSDHIDHGLTLVGRYNRGGYRLRGGASYHARSDWDPWGLPGGGDFRPDDDTYVTWQAGIGKTWHFPNFLKFGLELEYVDGSRLDRFSKYEFGFFSDVRVHGYQSDKIRAEEAFAVHLTYGFDVGELLRLDLVGDAAWATDRASGLDRELLGGAGVSGTLVGPWRTVLNIDLGAALTGPDDGFSVFVAVLKLFG